jgi:hypothetical protein
VRKRKVGEKIHSHKFIGERKNNIPSFVSWAKESGKVPVKILSPKDKNIIFFSCPND